jgi:type II secretion system protein N
MVKKIFDAIFNIFRFHKKKIGVILLATLIFAILLFPYSDLGDLLTAKISELTNNQLYLQFGDLGLNLFPQPGLEMRNVSVETPLIPPISVDTLTVAPSLTGLISFRPGVSARATGFLGGTISVSTRGGSKTEAGTRKQVISLSTSRTNISQMAKFMQLSVPLKGQLDLDANATVDPVFNEQPSGHVSLSIDKFEVVAGSVATAMGPLSLPQLNLSHVVLSGRLEEGRFTIEDGKLGDGKDELVGKIKGDVMMRVDRRGAQPAFTTGLYNLEFDFVVKPSLVQKATLFLSFLDSYKQPTSGGTRYAFRVSGSDFSAPPRIMPTR